MTFPDNIRKHHLGLYPNGFCWILQIVDNIWSNYRAILSRVQTPPRQSVRITPQWTLICSYLWPLLLSRSMLQIHSVYACAILVIESVPITTFWLHCWQSLHLLWNPWYFPNCASVYWMNERIYQHLLYIHRISILQTQWHHWGIASTLVLWQLVTSVE